MKDGEDVESVKTNAAENLEIVWENNEPCGYKWQMT